MAPKENWLQVNISDGLFPTERTVHFPTAEGEVSVFVSSSFLDEATRAIKVELLDQDDQYALVQVPSQSGSKVAKVRLAELRYTR